MHLWHSACVATGLHHQNVKTCRYCSLINNRTKSPAVAKIADRTCCQLSSRSSKVNDFRVILLILPILARTACKRLQIGTDMLLIVTSTGDELHKNVHY